MSKKRGLKAEHRVKVVKMVTLVVEVKGIRTVLEHLVVVLETAMNNPLVSEGIVGIAINLVSVNVKTNSSEKEIIVTPETVTPTQVVVAEE